MSALGTYISKLLHDNQALQDFIADPKGQCKAHGLSKADGAILRRSVAGLPATAKSGLGITRPLNSYRSSIRLLQNVLHNHHGHLLSSYNSNPVILPTICIYYNSTWSPPNVGAPYTDPHSAYVDHVYCFYKNNNTSAQTVGEAMGFTEQPGQPVNTPFSGSLDRWDGNGQVGYAGQYLPAGPGGPIKPFITSFTIDGTTYEIDFTGVTTHDRDPFWFYSVNGNVIVPINPGSNQYELNPEACYGAGFSSFADYNLNNDCDGSSVHNITWQAIAPDQNYGFAPCY